MTATSPKPRATWLLILALIAGASFWFVGQHTIPTLPWIAWKGAGVGLLTIWAALNARGRDGWLITAVMAFGTLGDVLLERSQIGGALAFLAGHLIAILLYLGHRRSKKTPSQVALAVLFVASDLLIFAKIGPLAGSLIPIILIWPLYFAGQALIAWGAVITLLRWKDDEDLHHRL